VLGIDDEQRKAPQPVAVQRERGARQLAIALRDPGASRVAFDQLVDADELAFGRRRRGRRVVQARAELGEGAGGEQVDGEGVVLAHRSRRGHRPESSRVLA
jgi:hypothetical protein